MAGRRSHRGTVCITLPLWLHTIWGWVGGWGGLSLWKSTHMDHTNRPKAASQMSPQWLSWHKHIYTCAHAHIQLNLPQDYSYARPDDQANCVPLFDGTCCVVISRMAFSCLWRAACLFGKWWFQGLTGRTEGDLVMTCFCIRATLNDTSFFFTTGVQSWCVWHLNVSSPLNLLDRLQERKVGKMLIKP